MYWLQSYKFPLSVIRALEKMMATSFGKIECMHVVGTPCVGQSKKGAWVSGNWKIHARLLD